MNFSGILRFLWRSGDLIPRSLLSLGMNLDPGGYEFRPRGGLNPDPGGNEFIPTYQRIGCLLELFAYKSWQTEAFKWGARN